MLLSAGNFEAPDEWQDNSNRSIIHVLAFRHTNFGDQNEWNKFAIWMPVLSFEETVLYANISWLYKYILGGLAWSFLEATGFNGKKIVFLCNAHLEVWVDIFF